MKIAYHDGRLFASLAFALCISATLLILLGDVLTGTATFAIKHWLTLVVLFGTILFGHIAKKASWANLKKYGFWVLFWLGTALVAYSSIGRQAETMTISATQAELDAIERLGANKDLVSNKAMLVEARAKLAAECASGAGKRCAGIERTIAVYTAAVLGNEATLKRLGPAKPVAPEADKLADVLAYWKYDPAQVKALAVLLQPVGYFAFFEYGSILSLGFVLGGQRKSRRARVPDGFHDSDKSSVPTGLLHANAPPVKITTDVRDIADGAILTSQPVEHKPVKVTDSEQSSFPAMTAEVLQLFKSPNRWTYQRDLS